MFIGSNKTDKVQKIDKNDSQDWDEQLAIFRAGSMNNNNIKEEEENQKIKKCVSWDVASTETGAITGDSRDAKDAFHQNMGRKTMLKSELFRKESADEQEEKGW